jgi:hypothetical protein
MKGRMIELINQTATGGNDEETEFTFTEEALEEFARLVIDDTFDELPPALFLDGVRENLRAKVIKSLISAPRKIRRRSK